MQKMRGENILEVKWFSKNELAAMSPNEFISSKTHALLKDWMAKKKYPLEIYKYLS